MKCGFHGGLVVDYPNSRKAKKFFLCLFTGGTNPNAQLPKGLTGEEGLGYEDAIDGKVSFEKERLRSKGRGKRKGPKETSKEWIMRKKEVGWSRSFADSLSTHHILALSETREGCRAERFQIYWTEAEAQVLSLHLTAPTPRLIICNTSF